LLLLHDHLGIGRNTLSRLNPSVSINTHRPRKNEPFRLFPTLYQVVLYQEGIYPLHFLVCSIETVPSSLLENLSWGKV
jgi:hypothetical protein